MMHKKQIYLTLIMCTFFIGFSVNALALLEKKTEEEKQAEIKEQKAELDQMVKETLAELYKLQPGAKKAISGSAGYAVFANFGTKIFVAGGGSGKGIAYNSKTKKKTYMKMIEVQAGLGFGVKKFKLVWVFDNAKDIDGFVNSGWEIGAQTTASAKLDDQGGGIAGAVQVSPGVWLYQLTDDGLALELTAKGTKYYKDDDLN